MTACSTRHLCSYQATLQAPQQDVGTAYFGRRMIAVVTGGQFEGERIKGKVLSGGDWATIEEARDVLRLDARVVWETQDGAKIYVSYGGVLRPLKAAQKIAAQGGTKSDEDRRALYFRTNPIFETGDSRYLWLNDIVAIGIGSLIPGGVSYEVFEVL